MTDRLLTWRVVGKAVLVTVLYWALCWALALAFHCRSFTRCDALFDHPSELHGLPGGDIQRAMAPDQIAQS